MGAQLYAINIAPLHILQYQLIYSNTSNISMCVYAYIYMIYRIVS